MTARPEPSPPLDGGGRGVGLRDGLSAALHGARAALEDRRLFAWLVAAFLVPVAVTAGTGLALSRTGITVPYLRRIVEPSALLLWPPTFAVAVAAGIALVAARTDDPSSAAATVVAVAARWRPLLGWGLLSVAGVLATGALALAAVEHPVFDPSRSTVELWTVVAALYAWSVLTFYVVPVIVFEDRGLVASLRRALGLLRRSGGAVVAVQALFTGGLVVLVVGGFTGGAFAFVAAGVSLFALPLGLLFLGAGLALVASSVAGVAVAFAAHCGLRYRLYERTR